MSPTLTTTAITTTNTLGLPPTLPALTVRPTRSDSPPPLPIPGTQTCHIGPVTFKPIISHPLCADSKCPLCTLSGATSTLWIAAWCCKCGEVVVAKEEAWNAEDEQCEHEGCGHSVCLVKCRVREYRVVVGMGWETMDGVYEEEESDGSGEESDGSGEEIDGSGEEYHDVCLEDEQGEDWVVIAEDEWED